jgi:anti-sigma B factor antagonist
MDDLVKLEVDQRGAVVVARVSGELDVSGASGLGEELAAAVPTSADGLVVDCTDLGFIDSSGIAMLFGLARHLASRRQQLRVVAPAGEPVSRVLELVDFERAAPVHADVDGAVAEIS